MRTTRDIDEALAVIIIEEYNSGLTMRTISDKYSVPYGQTNKILIANGISKRSISDNTKLPDFRKNCKLFKVEFDKSELKSLYGNGYTLHELGAHFNVSHVTAKNWLLKLDVKLRTPRESANLEKTLNTRRRLLKDKYGVENIMQLPHINEKSFKASHKLKSFNFKDIKFSGLQGFEPQGIVYLSEHYDVNPAELVTGYDVPRFNYQFEGRGKVYFPDFYYPPTNTIYEIKSEYTYNQLLELNTAKKAAVDATDYNFVMLVFDNAASTARIID